MGGGGRETEQVVDELLLVSHVVKKFATKGLEPRSPKSVFLSYNETTRIFC